ncbi:MAG: hypothetical protein WCL39_04985 [Armatimonadota bacterium]
MSQHGNEDHRLESIEKTELKPTASESIARPAETPDRLTRDKRYLELLSPTREGVCIHLLSPRHVSSDVWLHVVKDICWKK